MEEEEEHWLIRMLLCNEMTRDNNDVCGVFEKMRFEIMMFVATTFSGQRVHRDAVVVLVSHFRKVQNVTLLLKTTYKYGISELFKKQNQKFQCYYFENIFKHAHQEMFATI